MKRKTLLSSAAFLAGASALIAQVFSFQQPGTFAAPGSLPQPGGVWQSQWVSGKPYSATVVIHTVQTFAGQKPLRVDHTQTGLVFRDAQGRTRRETLQISGSWQANQVSVIDPVLGAEYDWTGPKMAGRGTAGSAVSGHFVTRMLNPALIASETRAPSRSPYELAVEEAEHTGPHHKKGSPNAGAQPPQPSRVEDLGAQTVNGVMAQGVRITTAIPAGTIGNDADIPVVTERWVSPDLQVLVKSVYSDPRFGTTTYELTDIQRTNPDPSLFQVPAGYQERPSKKGGGGGQGVFGIPVKQFSGAKGKQP